MSTTTRNYGALIQRTWDEHLLHSVLVELTYRCNLDCVFCYNDLRRAGRPLSREQYLTLLDELAALQVMNLVLSGGEPTTHPDFFAIGARARELGFVVRIKTNGHGLGPSVAQRLAREVEPFMLEVSLHGAAAVTHDRQTRVPGSFARLMDNLGHAANAGLRVKLNAVLTRWNEHELEAMFALADARGVQLQIDPQVTPRDDGDVTPTELRASDAGLARYYALMAVRDERSRAHATLAASREGAVETVATAEARGGAAGEPRVGAAREPAQDATPREPDRWPSPTPDPTPQRAHGQKHCGAGSGGLAIDPFGNVLPCVQWRMPIGNLHERGLRELWQGGSDTLDLVRAATTRAKTIVDEERRAGRPLVFCPGIAARETGDPTALYPAAQRAAQAALGETAKTKRLPIVR